MAGATYCVSCASLPVKDRSLAVKTAKCSECKTEYGVTSYGTSFRVPLVKRRWVLSPALYTGMMLGAGLFAFVIALSGLGLWSSEKVIGPTLRAQAPPTDLTRVPEVAVAERFTQNVRPEDAKLKIRQLIADMRQKNAG